MKLLLDENLSWRLVANLQRSFPGTKHADQLGLRGATDAAVWEHARGEGYMLVSKDDDFRQLALLRGAPPKVLVLAIGNGGNAAVLELLGSHERRIAAFAADDSESVLVLRSGSEPPARAPQ